MPAITYLRDCIFTIQGAGADDGNRYLAGDTIPSGSTARTLPSGAVNGPFTFAVDSVKLNFGRSVEDHSAGSSDLEHFRLKKFTQQIEVSKKLTLNDPIAQLLAVNDLVVFSLTGTPTGSVPEPFAITAALAIWSALESEFGAPSTMSFTLASYGRAFA